MSAARIVLTVVLLLAAAVALIVLGAPPLVVSFMASAVGAALVLGIMSAGRVSGATAIAPDVMQGADAVVPVERTAVGRIQLRLLEPTRSVWAPGVLAAVDGELRFVPSRPRDADRSWQGRVSAVELRRSGRACVIVARCPAGDAQFVAQGSVDDVAQALDGHLPLARG